jgi:ribose/xylose/arabinose/galactoside ABC-type transport system permease subunit
MMHRHQDGFSLLRRTPPAVPLLLAYAVIGLLLVPPFLSTVNIISILYSTAVLVPTVLGMQLLLTLGRFDLSTGATAALSGMVSGVCLLRSNSIVLALFVGVMVGLVTGAVIGLLVSYVKVDPLIATLAAMGIHRSLSLVVNGGGVVAGLPSQFGWLAEARIKGLPVLIVVALATILLAAFLNRNAVLFRRFYAAGSNPVAAVYSGINVKALVVLGYILASICSATTGLIQSSRTLSAGPQIFDTLAIDAIAACIIGGSSLGGGRGGILGASLGLIVITATDNMVIMLNIPVYWRGLVVGVLLLGVVALRQPALISTKGPKHRKVRSTS